MNVALIGYGNVGRALARLLHEKRREFPFSVTGIHTLGHGTALDPKGLRGEPRFGPRMASIAEFLDAAGASAAVELTTLNPSTGEPAISHIRAAFARGMHVATANKGPLAHAYAALRDEARRTGVGFRFESAVMDGAPVFNIWRDCLPGVKVLGFTGALNSTSKVVVEAMERGESFEDGLAAARAMGIAEGDGSFDVEGWDSAAKTAALANVLMDAGRHPAAGLHARHRAPHAPRAPWKWRAPGRPPGSSAVRGARRRVSRCGCARRFWSARTFLPARPGLPT